MYCDKNAPSPDVIARASQAIRLGQIVMHPTDTIYGLACDPLNAKALQRLFAIKGRSPEKGALVMIHDIEYCEDMCRNIPNIFHKLASTFWPGPITLLLHGKPSLPDLLLGREGKIGLRCPDLPLLQLWMKSIPGAIVSTSANFSGQEGPRSLAALRQLLFDKVDLFLEGEEIDEQTQASTVIDLTFDPPKVVRLGQWAERVKVFLES